MKYILIYLLFVANSNALEYTVGCYGSEGDRWVNSRYPTIEEAEDKLAYLLNKNTENDCDIMEEEEENNEER